MRYTIYGHKQSVCQQYTEKVGVFQQIFSVRSANLAREDSQMRESHAKSVRVERSFCVSVCLSVCLSVPVLAATSFNCKAEAKCPMYNKSVDTLLHPSNSWG